LQLHHIAAELDPISHHFYLAVVIRSSLKYLTSKRRVHGRIEVGNLQDLAMTVWGLFEIVALIVVGVFEILVVTTIMIQIDLFDITHHSVNLYLRIFFL